MTLADFIREKKLTKKHPRFGKAVRVGKAVGRGSVRYAEYWLGPMEPPKKPKAPKGFKKHKLKRSRKRKPSYVVYR